MALSSHQQQEVIVAASRAAVVSRGERKREHRCDRIIVPRDHFARNLELNLIDQTQKQIAAEGFHASLTPTADSSEKGSTINELEWFNEYLEKNNHKRTNIRDYTRKKRREIAHCSGI